MSKRVAFLSMTGVERFFVYDELAVAPLAARGVQVDTVPWRHEADWSSYDAVVIRSTWDYQDDVERFVEVLAGIEACTRLLNPLDVVRWNVDKRYLLELEARGVPIVPTRVHDGLTPDALDEARAAFGVDEIVVKPTVSANADGTFRLPLAADAAPALRTLSAREVLVQPFAPAIVDEGEVSVFAFDGAISHAILKTPAAGDFRVQEEHGGRLRALAIDPALQAAADRAFGALPGGNLLYARVDFVRYDGEWLLMEAELIEPSLYFTLDEASAGRFAEALARRLG